MTQSNAAANPFQHLATSLKKPGFATNSTVGPGSTHESEKFYVSYAYSHGSLQLVVVDPSNNYHATAYNSPLPSEAAAWGMAVGSDNNIYLGTAPNGHLFKFNTQTADFITDLGRPIDTEEYIWSLTMSPYDGKIYGGTYRHARIFSYDTTTSVLDPLNSFKDPDGDPNQPNQYVRFCVADPDPSQPYIYLGLGSTCSKIVAYNIHTKEAKRILPEPYEAISDFPSIWLGCDRKVYGYVRSSDPRILSNGTATPTSILQRYAPTNIFQNNDAITICEDIVQITHANGGNSYYPYTYPGKPLFIQRVGTGPDRNIYAGTAAPFYLASLSPANPENGFTRIARLGDGEAYSLLSYKQKLYIAVYAAVSTFMTYTPGSQVNLGPNIGQAWRPKTFVAAPNENLYAGSVGGYGQLNGALLAWNPDKEKAKYYNKLFPNQGQGIASLVVVEESCVGISGSKFCLVVGSTIYGGGGVEPAPDAVAALFIVDPTDVDPTVDDLTDPPTLKNPYHIPNMAKVTSITDLIVDPKTYHVYGIANDATSSPKKSYLFIFDPATGIFANEGTLISDASSGSPGSPVFVDDELTYDSVAIGSDGNIWGLASGWPPYSDADSPASQPGGVFKIEVKTNTLQFWKVPPQLIPSQLITSGFGFVKDPVNGDKIYFGSGADLYVYNVPKPS